MSSITKVTPRTRRGARTSAGVNVPGGGGEQRGVEVWRYREFTDAGGAAAGHDQKLGRQHLQLPARRTHAAAPSPPAHTHTPHTHTHTHPFNGPLFRTTRVGRYQKGKTNLDFTEARDSEWQ